MKKNWEVKRLGEVCEVIGGGTPSKANKKFYTGQIPWATVRDMKYDILKETEHKITNEAIKNSSTNIIPKGNVIIATRVGLGKVCILKNDTAINQDLRGIIPKKNAEVSVHYLFHWLKSISNIIQKEGTGATVQGVKLPFIKSLSIPLPSLHEQKRIVAILNEAFASIATAKEKAEKNFQNARDLFDSYLQGVFTNPGDGWEEKKFEEIVESNVIGLTKSANEQSLDKKYKYVKMNNITKDNHFDFSKYACVEATRDELLKYSLLNGDFLFNTRNSHELVGKSCIFEVNNEEAILFNNNIMRVRFNKKISSHFINYVFSSKCIIDKLNHLKSGTTNVSAIYYKDLKNLKLLIPPLIEQRTIVAKLDALSAETKKLEAIYQKKLDSLEELKKSILQKAFNGEL